VLHDEVSPTGAVDNLAVITQRDRHFSLDGDAPRDELLMQACRVGGFEETRTKPTVHSDGGPDGGMDERRRVDEHEADTRKERSSSDRRPCGGFSTTETDAWQFLISEWPCDLEKSATSFPYVT